MENLPIIDSFLAEQQVLNSMLMNRDTLIECIGAIGPDCFTDPAHRSIYDALCRHKTTDVSMIMDCISDPEDKLFDIIGLGAFISSDRSIDVLKDRSIRRRVVYELQSSAMQISHDYDVTGIDVLRTLTSKLQKIALSETKYMPQSVGDILPVVWDQLSKAMEEGSKSRAMTTGIKVLDDLLYFDNSDLIIIGARPSMGKSAFTSQLLRHNAKQGKTCLFFSVEMSDKTEVKRELFSESEVNQNAFDLGILPKSQLLKLSDGIDKLKSLPLYIDSEPGISPSKIRAKCSYIKNLVGALNVIAVDYTQICKSDTPKPTIRETITDIVREFKSIAKEFNVPFIALSQLSRDVERRENKRPQLSDLMESGDIEAVADHILFLYRDYCYSKNKETENIAEIVCGKQRNGPRDWLKEIYCDLSIGKFADLQKEDKFYNNF